MDDPVDMLMGLIGPLIGGGRCNGIITVGRITGTRDSIGQVSIMIWGLRAVLAVSFCGELGSIWAIYESHEVNLRGCSRKRRCRRRLVRVSGR